MAGTVGTADTGPCPLVVVSGDTVVTAVRVAVLGDWLDTGSCIVLTLTDGKAGDDAADSDECSTFDVATAE